MWTPLGSMVCAALTVTELAVPAARPPAAGLAAQGVQEGHAAIGTLKDIEAGGATIVIATAEGDRTFRLTSATTLHGLGANAGLRDLTGRAGASVWVHYVGEIRPVVRAMQYIGGQALETTTGTVGDVRQREREIVIRTRAGTEERFVVSERAPIDLVAGLVELDLLAEKRGLEVTIYYTRLGDIRVAWLVQQRRPAVS